MNTDIELFQKIDEVVFSKLTNTDLSKPRMMIGFSAVPGAGKTTIARVLAKDLGGIYTATDDMRRVIIDVTTIKDIYEINKILYRYLPHFYEKLSHYPNGLWVVDSTINSKAKEFFAMASRYKAKTFVVGLNVPTKQVRQQIIDRGDRYHADVSLYLESMPNHQKEHEEFTIKYTPDLTFSVEARDHIPEIIDAILDKMK